jgi:hypothetical protein
MAALFVVSQHVAAKASEKEEHSNYERNQIAPESSRQGILIQQ